MTKDFTSPRAKKIALALLALTQFILAIDASIVNVALPSIGIDLRMSQQSLSWTINAYILTFGGFLLLGGRLADLFGRKRMFIVGVVIFTLASLLGGLAQNEVWLNVARALQGLGAAITSPAALAILTTTFNEGPERNRALAVWGAMSGAGGAAGVLLGGVLTEYFGWEWVLFINVPIGAFIAWQAAWVLQPASVNKAIRGFDLPGAITVTGGVSLLVFTIVDGEIAGWISPTTMFRAACAVVLLFAFILIEMRHKTPLVNLSIFKLRSLLGANIVMLLVGASLIPMFFLTTLYTQQVLGFTPVQAGLTYLPLSFSLVLAASFASPMINRFGIKAVLIAALACVAAGLGWFSLMRTDGSFLVDLFGPAILSGFGLGISLVAVTVAALTGTTEEEAGLASGLINTGSQIGGAIGLAVISAIASATTSRALATGVDQATSLTSGFHDAFVVAALLAVLAIVFSATMIPSRSKGQV